MSIRDRHDLKASAKEALASAPDNRKLVLISTGASVAVSLAASLLSFLLDNQIAGTGGLSGLGLRSVLSTVQSLLSMGLGLLFPFWSLGYVSAVLKLSRGENTSPGTLLDGFRRFWPALRLMLLQEVIYVGVVMLCIYIGSTILSFTPLAAPLYEVMLPLMSDTSVLTDPGSLDSATQAAILDAMVPLLIGILVLCVIALIPLVYHFRMAQFRLMDDGTCGAVMALRDSSRMMRRNCLALFRLDLSFWWFYLAQTAITVLSYGDVIFNGLGISLPFSNNVAFFVFYVIGLLTQLLLFYCSQNFVEVTYAKAYETLRQPPAEPETQASVPWNY